LPGIIPAKGEICLGFFVIFFSAIPEKVFEKKPYALKKYPEKILFRIVKPLFSSHPLSSP
jgi:hypothetical protein